MQTRQAPKAPSVYRPQPVPKVLQKKTAINQPPPVGQTERKLIAPAAYRPQPTPKVLQRKTASTTPRLISTTPRPTSIQPKPARTAPRVYRPEQNRIVQPRMGLLGQPQKNLPERLVKGQPVSIGPMLNPARKNPRPTIQCKWKDYNDTVKVWDRLLGGARWWYDTETDEMSFEAVDLSQMSEDLMALRDVSQPYEAWLALWQKNNWITPETDLSYLDAEDGQIKQWTNPDYPYNWEWWEDKALYKAELAPRHLTHYHQRGLESCGIDAIRMVFEGRTGIPLDRDELMDYIDNRIMAANIVAKSGLAFHNLPKAFNENGLSASAQEGVGLDALEAILKKGATVLREGKAHVVVIDGVIYKDDKRYFLIRDPAKYGGETVPDTDPRLLGTGRVVIVKD